MTPFIIPGMFVYFYVLWTSLYWRQSPVYFSAFHYTSYRKFAISASLVITVHFIRVCFVSCLFAVSPSICSLPIPCYTAVVSFLCFVLTLLFDSLREWNWGSRYLCAQSCSTLWNLLGSFVCGTFQARILECIAISSSRGCFPLRYQTHIFWVSCIAGRFLLLEPLKFKDHSFLLDIHLPNWV